MAIVLDHQQVLDIAEVLDLEYEAIHWNYSGRGMYGKTCIGFEFRGIGDVWNRLLNTYPKHPIDALVEYHSWASQEAYLAMQALHDPSYDAMGYDTILYFPGVSVDKAPEEDY